MYQYQCRASERALDVPVVGNAEQFVSWFWYLSPFLILQENGNWACDFFQALLQYSFYYKWCHFRQDRHKQTVSSELPIVIKLAIFQTIHSLSPSVTFQSPALSNRGVYYLSCTSVHFQENSRIIVQILYNYTWAPHCFWGGGAHTKSWVDIWYRTVSGLTHSRADTENTESVFCSKYVTNWMPE